MIIVGGTRQRHSLGGHRRRWCGFHPSGGLIRESMNRHVRRRSLSEAWSHERIQFRRDEVIGSRTSPLRLPGRASMTKAQAENAVNAVFEAMRDALANRDTMTVPGFGWFSTNSRRARTGRDPRIWETIAIPASRALWFNVGKALQDGLRWRLTQGPVSKRLYVLSKACPDWSARRGGCAAHLVPTGKGRARRTGVRPPSVRRLFDPAGPE